MSHRSPIFASLLVVIALLLTACSDTATPQATVDAATATPASTGKPVTGQRTFVLAPELSKASYLADEEFLGGALAKYGINAGRTVTVGTTQEIEGQLQLDLDNLASALGDNQFTVKLNTLTSSQSLRDQWLRAKGPNFDAYPLATFRATSIEGSPSSYADGQEVAFKLAGEMTIRDIAKPATFEVKAKLAGDTLTGVATGRLLMSDFGIEPPNFANTLTVADNFGIEVEFTAKEKKP